jgi:hypothetical protein
MAHFLMREPARGRLRRFPFRSCFFALRSACSSSFFDIVAPRSWLAAAGLVRALVVRIVAAIRTLGNGIALLTRTWLLHLSQWNVPPRVLFLPRVLHDCLLSICSIAEQ